MTGRTLDLLFALPLVGAFVVLFSPRQWATAIRRFTLLVALAELGLALTLLRLDFDVPGYVLASRHGYVWDLGMSFRLGLDGASASLVILTALITPIALSFSWSTVTTKVKEHAVCFLFLEAGLVGAFLAADLFLFYICWELVLIPLYVLIGMWGTGERAFTSTKFFLYTLAGSMIMLLALLYLGNVYADLARHPSYALTDLRALVLPLRYQIPLFSAFALAFLIKMPMFPLHTWSPETYRDAPVGVAIMASALVAKLGGYGLFRFAVGMYPLAVQHLGPTLAVLVVVSILFGALAAFAQRDLKMLLAYASMSHMGFVTLGLLSLTAQGASGALFQMVSHGIVTAGLFLIVGVVESRTGTRDVTVLSGLATGRPRFALLFVLIALAGAGVPATSGFVGELLVLVGTYASNEVPGFQNYSWSFAFTAALGMIFGALYILKVLRSVAFGPPRAEDEGKPDLSRTELSWLAPIGLLVVVLGVFPSFVLDRLRTSTAAVSLGYAERAARDDRATRPYINDPALAAPPPAPPEGTPQPRAQERAPTAPGAPAAPEGVDEHGHPHGAHAPAAPAPDGDVPPAPPTRPQIRVMPDEPGAELGGRND